MTTIDDRVPLGVECAWPLPASLPTSRPPAWAMLLAALRRALA